MSEPAAERIDAVEEAVEAIEPEAIEALADAVEEIAESATEIAEEAVDENRPDIAEEVAAETVYTLKEVCDRLDELKDLLQRDAIEVGTPEAESAAEVAEEAYEEASEELDEIVEEVATDLETGEAAIEDQLPTPEETGDVAPVMIEADLPPEPTHWLLKRRFGRA